MNAFPHNAVTNDDFAVKYEKYSTILLIHYGLVNINEWGEDVSEDQLNWYEIISM